MTAMWKNAGGQTPSKDVKKNCVPSNLVNILVHYLAEKLEVNLNEACPTDWFWDRFIKEFGLMNGQGMIGSKSPLYMRRVWRNNFTIKVNRAPHPRCKYCPTDPLIEPAVSSYNCPVCTTEVSTWNSLRNHIQRKHQISARTLISDLKTEVSILTVFYSVHNSPDLRSGKCIQGCQQGKKFLHRRRWIK